MILITDQLQPALRMAQAILYILFWILVYCFMEQSPRANLIYYSLPTKTGYLHPLSVPWTQFNPLHFRHSTSRKCKLEALTFREPLGFLGKQYKDFLIVCIPAHSIQEVSTQLSEEQGFIKVDYKTQYPCYLSGKRSAILPKHQNQSLKYLRYKGCGNQFGGFVHQIGVGLRGSHFYHTSKRQMLMTHEINLALQKRGKPGANKPLGYYEYPAGFLDQMEEGKSVSDDIPNLLKYCCVFETLGQRRLGTHLISSLDIIISECLGLEFDKLKGLFEKYNRYDDGVPQSTPIEWEFSQLTEGTTFLSNMLLKRKQNKEPLNLINYFVEQIQSTLKQTYSENVEFIERMIKSFNITSPYSQIFRQKLTLLLKNKNLLLLIMILCSKIGTEVGEFKRILIEEEINWGFFEDHNITHCNAHLNNFVILEDLEHYNDCLLGPLDFDLSFKKEEYISIQRQSPKYGSRDDVEFQNLLQGQYKSLQLSMSGLEVMNFKYGISEEEFETQEKRHQYQMLRYLMRDQIMHHFQNGFHLQQYEHKQLYSQHKKDIRQLIEVCLILSMTFQT